MSAFDLSFASGEDSLSVRHFSVSEGLSSLFEVSVTAVSPLDDIDFEPLVGQAASFVIHGDATGRPAGAGRGSSAASSSAEAEPTGLSTYAISLVPQLWLLTQRQDNRIFQHLTVPAIVREVLAYHRIEPVLELDASRYPVQEYRVEYGESDFAFVSRLLEDAGITYRFAWHPEKGTTLVLSDAPQRRDRRPGGAIPFVAEPSGRPTTALVTRVSASREMKPGAYAIRDFDFRRRLDFEPTAQGQKSRREASRIAPTSSTSTRPGAPSSRRGRRRAARPRTPTSGRAPRSPSGASRPSARRTSSSPTTRTCSTSRRAPSSPSAATRAPASPRRTRSSPCSAPSRGPRAAG